MYVHSAHDREHDGAASLLLSPRPATTVVGVEPDRVSATAPGMRDPDSRAWIDALRAPGPDRDAAVSDLHAYLLRVAWFEVDRRRSTLEAASRLELDDLAMQSADDALVAILRKLEDFRGESRFTTWAAKFAILEASVKCRRRAWQRREVTIAAEQWEQFSSGARPEDEPQSSALRVAVGAAMRSALSDHQREVLAAVVFQDVPIDVLAARLGSTRGAVYKTLHDARRSLRAELLRMEAL